MTPTEETTVPLALESKDRRRRVRPDHAIHKDHAPVPLLVINPADVLAGAKVIRREVVRLQRTGAGSFVFIAPNLEAFVVSDLRSVAQAWVRERFGWLVALYSPRRSNGETRWTDGSPILAATVAGIAEDIGEHLRGLR